MKIKVCGMKVLENIQQLSRLDIDYIGLIFYSKSPRACDPNTINWAALKEMGKEFVGVFVNTSIEDLLSTIEGSPINTLQLHGNESPEYCQELKSKGYTIIKAFGVGKDFRWQSCKEYLESVDYFLFDTQSKNHGGTGKKFDWEVMKSYPYNKPFLLSGGISLDDLSTLQKLKLNRMLGVDVNSRFEIEPGIKKIDDINIFTRGLHSLNKDSKQ
ncbi:MAG: phosphoribosylanthranilate isomerase [Prolixibacteraceae bacterium]|jgi:phosphoribosylanthranilate isomerase|nr:phosphoribosylanthranilate isomerase [Prolixibacteraceae bacterium]